jgi:methylmalonyl-CoA mutase N-terminal domain/subunit
VKASRITAEVEATLNKLEDAARSTENLMPRIVNAAAALATVGEMSDRLRRVFGEYQERG